MLYSADFLNDYPLVVCYYTINTMYEQEVNDLIKSLETFKISYRIYGIFSFGSWLFNTGYKAEFMQIMMEKYNIPLVWLDADSVIYNTPTLFKELKIKDIHCCVRIRGDNKSPNLHSAIIYFNNDNEGKQIIKDWVLQSKINMYKVWDQMCLEYVFLKNPEMFALFPLTYSKKAKKRGTRIILQKQISNVSVNVIDNDKDTLMYICSHERIIKYVHENIKDNDFNIDTIQNIGKMYIEENNITNLKCNFNPYIFLFSYFEYTQKFISKELYSPDVEIKNYVDFESIYIFYIKNKYKLGLFPQKYAINHYYACDLLHSFLHST